MKRMIGAMCLALLMGSCAPAQKKPEVVFWQFWPLEVIQPLVTAFEA